MEIAAIIFVICFAIAEAQDDAKQIARHERIDHAGQWLFRAGLVFMWCGGVWLAEDLASAVKVGLLSAPVFSFVFRLSLNTLRGLDPRYVSESNVYDTVFLWASRGDVNLAGSIAYAVELLAAMAVIILVP